MVLALKLGRTLEELGRISSYEFQLWLALYKDTQWGDLRADERAGIVAAVIANYAGMTRGSGTPPAQASDFMPHLPVQSKEVGSVVDEPDPVAFFSAVAAGK